MAPVAGFLHQLDSEMRRADGKNPEATVIIPTFNRREMVSAAIASVAAQVEVKFELIIVDDGSTDGTWEALAVWAARLSAAHADRMIVRTLRLENRGVAAARNAGAAAAAAPLLAFLDSDDLWRIGKLRRQVHFMEAHAELSICQTAEIWMRRGRRVNPGVRHRKRAGDLFVDSLRTCLISPSAVMMRTSLFHQLGGFDEDLLAAEDYDLWLRVVIDHQVGLIDEPLVTRQAGHYDQLSATIPALDRFRILSLMKLLARHDLPAQRRDMVVDALVEKCRIYAKGLANRGRQETASFILDSASRAKTEWLKSGDDALARAISLMRILIKDDHAIERLSSGSHSGIAGSEGK